MRQIFLYQARPVLTVLSTLCPLFSHSTTINVERDKRRTISRICHVFSAIANETGL